ncbi:GNAT family N-acetyltransferase [Stackebrandtia sp.]|uniref:GNAT family N-acetyltransferase n=1 Tax=Stackebrandtia sp. TaxID=2023065 RepID=UPI0032C22B80
MSRRMGNLTLDTLDDLPRSCRSCVFWELSPDCSTSQPRSPGRSCAGDPGLDKEAWVSKTLLEWGSCGRVAYVDDMPAGFVTYAAPQHVPRASEFPSGPASADAAVLMTAHVVPAFASTGLGRLLVQAAAHDLSKRGVRALEVFGDARGEPGACVAPADFFRSLGFKTVRAHPHYPRLRMELRHLPGWGEGAGTIDAEVERWLASVTIVQRA